MCLKTNNSKDVITGQIIKTTQELVDISKERKIKDKLFQYELVRLNGKYNMLDEQARNLTGLSKEDYIFIIEHYTELMKQYPDVKERALKTLEYIKSADIVKVIAIKGCENCIEKVCKKLDVYKDDLCENCRQIVEQHIS